MSNETPAVHPFTARLVGMREAFVPELSDQELRQINDIAHANPELTDKELNAKVSAEFGLQKRYDAGLTREQDTVAMADEIRAFIVKWRILPMVDPQLVTGYVMHGIIGLSAVVGGFIEDKMSKVDNPPAG